MPSAPNCLGSGGYSAPYLPLSSASAQQRRALDQRDLFQALTTMLDVRIDLGFSTSGTRPQSGDMN